MDGGSAWYIFKYSLESRATRHDFRIALQQQSLQIRPSWVLGADLTNTPYLSGEKQPSFVIFSSTLDYLQTS